MLVSQNRQAVKDRLNADLDYQVNVKAEMEMSVMAIQIRDIQRKLHYLHCDVLEVKEGKEVPHTWADEAVGRGRGQNQPGTEG